MSSFRPMSPVHKKGPRINLLSSYEESESKLFGPQPQFNLAKIGSLKYRHIRMSKEKTSKI